MDNILFKKVMMHSGKLEREIELEAYEDEDKIIVTTSSLKKVFESLKETFGITDTVTTDIRINDKGNLVYASAEWRLKDKTGYDSVFIGEAAPLNLDSLIAKKYPKTTAYNRAQSAGIIAYLQLPGKIYSDTQIFADAAVSDNTDDADNNSKPEKKETINSIVEANAARKAKDAAGSSAGIIISVPEMPEDTTDDESKPENDESKPEAVPEVVTNTEEPDTEELPFNDIPSAESTEESAKPATDGSSVTNETLVGIGIYSNTTIGELIALKNSGDKAAANFISLVKKGAIRQVDANKQQIINYIKTA